MIINKHYEFQDPQKNNNQEFMVSIWAIRNSGWLGYTGDYTIQLCRDYDKPL